MNGFDMPKSVENSCLYHKHEYKTIHANKGSLSVEKTNCLSAEYNQSPCRFLA